ncbi:MAG: hypothetical protein ABI884_02605, partial [Gemmatimonadota bacterium]
VAAEGINGLGINSLASAAQCDKVLIYRYFGGLSGVLAALGAERMVWPRIAMPSVDGGEVSLAEAVEGVLLEEWAALSGSTLMLASSAAELAPGGEALGAATAEQRAEHHAKMIAAVRERYQVPAYVDLPALVELLSAALTVFALRTAHAIGPNPGALDTASPPGWRRIEKMISAVTRALLDTNG